MMPRVKADETDGPPSHAAFKQSEAEGQHPLPRQVGDAFRLAFRIRLAGQAAEQIGHSVAAPTTSLDAWSVAPLCLRGI